MSTRTSYVSGPGVVVRGSAALFTQGDIKIVERIETDPIDVAYFGGTQDLRAQEVVAEVSFTPSGEFTTTDIGSSTTPGELFKHLDTVFGSNLFPTTDVPLYVYGVNGDLYTYYASALTKFPQIRLAARQHPLGECTFTCIRAGETTWSTANSFNRYQSGQTAPAQLTSDACVRTNIVRSYAAGAWGTYWDPIYTIDGFTIDITMNTFDKQSDQWGRTNIGLSGAEVKCTFTPERLTKTDLINGMGVQGGTSARGMSLNASSQGDLSITAGTSPSIAVVLYDAVITESGNTFGLASPRNDAITFMATRSTLTTTPKIRDLCTVYVTP